MANEPQMPDVWPQVRSNYFILAIQMDAMCHALRIILSTGQPVGPSTSEFVSHIRDTFVASIGSGKTIEHISAIKEDSVSSDVYAVAELLRATIYAFLTPEEIASRGRFGFVHE